MSECVKPDVTASLCALHWGAYELPELLLGENATVELLQVQLRFLKGEPVYSMFQRFSPERLETGSMVAHLGPVVRRLKTA